MLLEDTIGKKKEGFGTAIQYYCKNLEVEHERKLPMVFFLAHKFHVKLEQQADIVDKEDVQCNLNGLDRRWNLADIETVLDHNLPELAGIVDLAEWVAHELEVEHIGTVPDTEELWN
jgi:hypothetical protein